mmetsp:Transcript_38043/g.113884  ORF Transcript_38043/g.113884 Transcript_38043/m.113884 type:complete len:112 (-) Transcript_38043:422-757(-)
MVRGFTYQPSISTISALWALPVAATAATAPTGTAAHLLQDPGVLRRLELLHVELQDLMLRPRLELLEDLHLPQQLHQALRTHISQLLHLRWIELQQILRDLAQLRRLDQRP